MDFLILGDGYTAAERGKFEKDARRLVEILFSVSPFKERRSDFNVWGLCPPAEESGISRPRRGSHRRSRVGATYDAFGSERYVLTFENRSLRDVAAFAPYEFIEILTNTRTYGGGGIFNLYSTVAADSLWSPYVFVHEFGHHFAGLADEYYTSDVAYEAGRPERVEPWEPNATALHDPTSLKWKDLVSPGTPIPTPWNKEAYETHARTIQEKRRKIRAENRPEEEMDALFTRAEEAGDDGCSRGREIRRQGRRVRGRDVRGEGLLPAADRLRDVLARRRAVLRRLPAGDRARSSISTRAGRRRNPGELQAGAATCRVSRGATWGA